MINKFKKIIPSSELNDVTRGYIKTNQSSVPNKYDLSINGMSYSSATTSVEKTELSWTSVGTDVDIVGYRTSDGQWALKLINGETTSPWELAPNLDKQYGDPVVYVPGQPHSAFEVFGLKLVSSGIYTDGLYTYEVKTSGSGTWTPPYTPILVDVIVMGGGGGGGTAVSISNSNAGNAGGGGGSGKLIIRKNFLVQSSVSWSVGGSETASSFSNLTAPGGSRGNTGNGIGNLGSGGDGGSGGAGARPGRGGGFGSGGHSPLGANSSSSAFGQGFHIASGGGGGGGAYWNAAGGPGGYGPMGIGGTGGTVGSRGQPQSGFQGIGYGSGSGGNSNSNNTSQPGRGGIILFRYPIDQKTGE